MKRYRLSRRSNTPPNDKLDSSVKPIPRIVMIDNGKTLRHKTEEMNNLIDFLNKPSSDVRTTDDSSSAGSSTSLSSCQISAAKNDNTQDMVDHMSVSKNLSSPQSDANNKDKEIASIQPPQKTEMQSSSLFTTFRIQYLVVFTAIMLADGLQG